MTNEYKYLMAKFGEWLTEYIHSRGYLERALKRGFSFLTSTHAISRVLLYKDLIEWFLNNFCSASDPINLAIQKTVVALGKFRKKLGIQSDLKDKIDLLKNELDKRLCPLCYRKIENKADWVWIGDRAVHLCSNCYSKILNNNLVRDFRFLEPKDDFRGFYTLLVRMEWLLNIKSRKLSDALVLLCNLNEEQRKFILEVYGSIGVDSCPLIL